MKNAGHVTETSLTRRSAVLSRRQFRTGSSAQSKPSARREFGSRFVWYLSVTGTHIFMFRGRSCELKRVLRIFWYFMSTACEILSAGGTTANSPNPLVSYAIEGLRRCWMPALGRYSYRFLFVVPEPCNESRPESDAFYTLNVLLGLSQLAGPAGWEYLNLKNTYDTCCAELRSPMSRIYGLGMALWVAARFDIEPAGWLIDRIDTILADRRTLHRSSAQDIGMLLSGCTALGVKESRRWRTAAEKLSFHLREHYCDPGCHLFYNESTGHRRRFSSFASQVYSILALYQFADAFAVDWALELANRAAQQTIELQGPRGEWAWFYYVPGARIVDFYEIYSVHQHGMAPAFLHHAVDHGVPGARQALVKGFLWLFHDNEMAVSMLRPKEKMFYRSQLRKGELASARWRAGRSMVNAFTGRSDSVTNHRGLVLRQECRSYELGWILWSFGPRSDYPELTERMEFAVRQNV
jgi:hypothetical protein